VVGRAHVGGPHLCTLQSHQVPSTGGLHRGMDRHPAPPARVQAEPWTMYFDGSLMKTGAGVGVDAKVNLQTQRANTQFNVNVCQPI